MNIMEYKRRTAITESLRTEKTPREIITFFEYSKSTVYNVAKKVCASEEFKEGSTARKKHAREKSTRTPGEF